MHTILSGVDLRTTLYILFMAIALTSVIVLGCKKEKKKTLTSLLNRITNNFVYYLHQCIKTGCLQNTSKILLAYDPFLFPYRAGST